MNKFSSITFLVVIILHQALHGSRPWETGQNASPNNKRKIASCLEQGETINSTLPGHHTETSKSTASAIANLSTLTTVDNIQVPQSIKEAAQLAASYAATSRLYLPPVYKETTYFSDATKQAHLEYEKQQQESGPENKFDIELAAIISTETSRLENMETKKQKLIDKRLALGNNNASNYHEITNLNKAIASIENTIRNQITLSTNIIRMAMLETNKQLATASSPQSSSEEKELDSFANDFIYFWNGE